MRESTFYGNNDATNGDAVEQREKCPGVQFVEGWMASNGGGIEHCFSVKSLALEQADRW